MAPRWKMKNYTLETVETGSQVREFHDLPKKLYKGNRYWVCPLDDDVESRFDPGRNELFEEGDAIRWLLRDGSGKVVGRIAAFYNTRLANLNDQPTGSCGFFECIDDQKAADLLFDAARQWLAYHGMEAMDGPVNFGDRDQWWGLLTDGFQLQPLYANPYNPPYYQQLFENYGFKNYFNQYTYSRNIRSGEFNPTVYERVKRLQATPGYRFEHIRKKDLEQVAENFRMIYNKSWSQFEGVKPMDKEHTQKLMRTLKPIMDEKLIYFAFFNDQPVGFFIMVPDLNRVIGRLRGKMNLINGLRLLAMLKFTKRADRIFGITFGVVPEYQGKGIEAGMMHAFEQYITTHKSKYKTLELAWTGDFNPVMLRMLENYVCAVRHKTHVTYRYLFDREKEFKRCPRLGVKRTN